MGRSDMVPNGGVSLGLRGGGAGCEVMMMCSLQQLELGTLRFI